MVLDAGASLRDATFAMIVLIAIGSVAVAVVDSNGIAAWIGATTAIVLQEDTETAHLSCSLCILVVKAAWVNLTFK